MLSLARLRLSRPSCHISGQRVVRLYIRQMTAPASFVVPEGYTLHKENSSAILLPASNDAFLNPVQEFNRDLSVACIRTWGETMNREKERKWRQSLERRAKKKKPVGEEHQAKKVKSESRACLEVFDEGHGRV